MKNRPLLTSTDCLCRRAEKTKTTAISATSRIIKMEGVVISSRITRPLAAMYQASAKVTIRPRNIQPKVREI